jgi:DNA repair protein RadC
MIRDLPQGEWPRERLRDLGPSYLSNPELIAILLRTGVQGESVLSLSTGLLAVLGGGGPGGHGARASPTPSCVPSTA